MRHISSLFFICGCLGLGGSGCLPLSTEQSTGNGTTASGGESDSGGTTAAGGAAGSGGVASAGGSGSGGSGDSGGAGSGGSAGNGGSVGNGGSIGNGGSVRSGGTATSGGTVGSGGQGESGGSTGLGGRAGGRAGTGGTTASGGQTTTAGGSTGNGGGPGGAAGNCVTQSAKTSSKIATVGIVTWSSTVAGLKSAKIDFGLDTSYGMTAPVDKPASGENATLLLGMKQSKTYHYRITATGSDGDCVGPDATIQTGALMTGLPKVTMSGQNKSALDGGFLIAGQFVSMGIGSGVPAYIIDADGDIVWAYKAAKDAGGVVMSYDGKWMWINAVNVPSGAANVHRVSMDGLTDEDKSSSFAGLNHQLTVLPDETVAFYAYNQSKGCEDIKEYSPSGNVKTIVNAGTAQGGASACHLNNIQYSKEDDSLVFSDLDTQVVAKVKRSDGSTVWVLNGSKATFTGDTWKGSQHGIHLLGLDRFLLFNNNSRNVAGGFGSAGGAGDGSIAVEYKLDLSAKKITKVWSYKSDVQNDVMGDLQRLDNGNTVIAYSTQGVLQVVDADGKLLQEWNWPLGAAFGYIQQRKSLYGPPPR